MIESTQGPAKEIIVSIDTDLKELIPWYLQKRESDVRILSEKIVQGDFETIRMLGHSMKGSGGTYGFTHITAIGYELEASARTMNSEGVRRGIEKLSHYLRQIKVIYV